MYHSNTFVRVQTNNRIILKEKTMSKFSGQSDLYDFVENYGGFEKFKNATNGEIYYAGGQIQFSKKKDIAPYYSHRIIKAEMDADVLLVEISKKSYRESRACSEASRDFFKWQEEREVKRLNDLDE